MTAKYKPGDVVIYFNGNGIRIGERTIARIDEPFEGDDEHRYFITPTDTPWYSIRESQLKQPT
ncbi:hypothetical protein D7O18_23370 [Salmonella enterica subsp. enterica serovar Muenchen]|nr:hypothetical protein [Salmonella enterica subsp. enterica serovar Muenchen]